MYAEYIGAKSIWRVGFAQEPGWVLTVLDAALEEHDGKVAQVPSRPMAVPIPKKTLSERLERV
jgi:hypothetical protein